MMALKNSPQFIHSFKLLGASFGPSMIGIFREMPHLPPQKTYTGEAVFPCKDILDIACLDNNREVAISSWQYIKKLKEFAKVTGPLAVSNIELAELH